MLQFAQTLVWKPWPEHFEAAAYVSYLETHAGVESLIALLGNTNHTETRAGFGIIAIPTRTEILPKTQTQIQQLFNTPNPQALRIVLLSYEDGYACVDLPRYSCSTISQNETPSLVYDCEAGLVLNHHTQEYACYPNKDHPLCKMFEELMHASKNARPINPTQELTWQGTESFETYAQQFQTLQAHLRAGDIYQANLSRVLTCDAKDIPAPVCVFKNLYDKNPTAHTAYLRTQACTMISNSMETLLTYNAQTHLCESFPIKGTSPRESTRAHDTRSQKNLQASPKDRAEHIMIVDLVRNDLGRVCIPSSVHVQSLMHTEGYHNVWHLVSHICGTLSPKHTPGDAAQALFPGGSITGAPKRSAMQILKNIETTPRGYYTGSLALITPQGDISMSILIRTLTQKNNQAWELRVGGGIVIDSDVTLEWKETIQKAAVFV